MDDLKFIRIDPKYMEDKYKYEDEITYIIFKDLFNIEIKYIEPIYKNFYKERKYIDKKWEKILTLIHYSFSDSSKKYYIDHDIIINPRVLSMNKINATFGAYCKTGNKLMASFIDMKIIQNYKNILSENIFLLKDINNEEILFKEIISKFNKFNNVNYFDLPFNTIENLTFQMHYNINFIQPLIIKNKKIKNKKYLINLTKKLRRIYEK